MSEMLPTCDVVKKKKVVVLIPVGWSDGGSREYGCSNLVDGRCSLTYQDCDISLTDENGVIRELKLGS